MHTWGMDLLVHSQDLKPSEKCIYVERKNCKIRQVVLYAGLFDHGV